MGVRCDACGRYQSVDEDRYASHTFEPEGWVSFGSGHNEWGNDSVDSDDRHDVCSFACYVAVMRDIYKRFGEYESLRADGKDRTFIAALIGESA